MNGSAKGTACGRNRSADVNEGLRSSVFCNTRILCFRDVIGAGGGKTAGLLLISPRLLSGVGVRN